MQIVSNITLLISAVSVMIISILLFVMSGSGTAESVPYIFLGVIIVTGFSVAVLVILLALHVFGPIRKIANIAQQMAEGKIASETYRGPISPGKIRKSDELTRLALAFESMRRRLVYLEGELSKSKQEKTTVLEEVSGRLVDQERALLRSNAMLAGQDNELKKINEGLSAKNRELSDAYKRLQKMDELKSDFLMIAAHELRTPIQPIIGFVELAEKGEISPKEAFKVIGSEARRLAALSTDLLDAGRIENGTFSYNMKPLSIVQLINEATASSSKFATQDGVVTIHTELDRDLKISGDKNRLIQALENIINNSIKYAEGGKIVIQTRNNYDNGLVEIKVSDGGPGIPPDILPIVFDKFVTKTEANKRGAGLGLFITKTIIEAHGGTIAAANNSSGPGSGATFTISLPIAGSDNPGTNPLQKQRMLRDQVS